MGVPRALWSSGIKPFPVYGRWWVRASVEALLSLCSSVVYRVVLNYEFAILVLGLNLSMAIGKSCFRFEPFDGHWKIIDSITRYFLEAVKTYNGAPQRLVSSEIRLICDLEQPEPTWTSQAEFIIPYDLESLKNNYFIGIRLKMRFEGEEAPEQRFIETIVGIEDRDPHKWSESKWRCLKVQWDETSTIPRPDRKTEEGEKEVPGSFLRCLRPATTSPEVEEKKGTSAATPLLDAERKKGFRQLPPRALLAENRVDERR
nr:auxin response factor 2 [Ipomoea batatas]